MACEVVILESAQREIEDIVRYLVLVLGSRQAADNFVNELERQTSIISSNPFIHGLSRMPELAASNWRSFFIGNYIALYTTIESAAFIAHVFHQTQDYARYI